MEAILAADTRQFDSSMDKSESRMTSVAKSMGKAGVAGAALAHEVKRHYRDDELVTRCRSCNSTRSASGDVIARSEVALLKGRREQ